MPPVHAVSEALTDERAGCLERFLESTADEGTMTRAHRALAVWHAHRANGASLQVVRPDF